MRFICEFCGKEFEPQYRLSKNKMLHYCSKSCAAKAAKGSYYNKTQLENVIKKIIKEQNKYLTVSDIISLLNISSKTLAKFRISTLSLNKECGMKKPKSVFENKVGEYLKKFINDIEYEKSFDDCLSEKGYKLYYDFYSKKYNLLIEADGNQHIDNNHPWYNEYNKQSDEIKNQYCLNNHIVLIRIPYTNNVTEEYVYSFIKAQLTTT